MGLNLSNPKTFLPLLLFIGFVFALFGMGGNSLSQDSGAYVVGLLIIAVAVLLWVVSRFVR